MKLKGSKTEQNLMEAFAGESQARNKYSYYSSMAKKEGYNLIADIFTESAENEKEHAKIWFTILNGYKVPDTITNLKEAASGENNEWTTMYKEFAETAKAEGFETIATLFSMIGDIEKEHEERFKALLRSIEDGTAFVSSEKTEWKCANCGHIHRDNNAPEKCPVCYHPRAYFERRVINY